MQTQSPLLQQARKGYEGPRFRIPRRGRIRIVLLLVVTGIAVRLFLGGDRQDASVPSSADTLSAGDVEKRAQPSLPPDVKLGRRRSLDRDDLSRILEHAPIRMDGAADTVGVRDGRVVLHYSLSPALQEAGRSLLSRYHPKYGAIAAIDPVGGRVLALVSYNNPEEPPLDKHLCLRSLFPAASVFKMITAAGAIEKAGMSGSTQLRRSGDNHTLYRSQLEPELKSFNLISLSDAFAYSINPVFGRLGIYSLGVDGLLEYAQRFGFAAQVPFELPHEAAAVAVVDSPFALAELASGFNQETRISPLFGALLAAAVSNHGAMPVPTLVDSVTDLREGARLYRAEQRLWRAPITQRTAEEMVGLMKGVVRYGTARRSFNTYIRRSGRFTEIDCGGKTGSVDKDGIGRVDWFVGFARHRSDPLQHIAVGVVTVHGANWTVHSSFVAAEIIRCYIREVQMQRESVKVVSSE